MCFQKFYKFLILKMFSVYVYFVLPGGRASKPHIGVFRGFFIFGGGGSMKQPEIPEDLQF